MDRRSHVCLPQFRTIFLIILGFTICLAAPSTNGNVSKTEPALLIVSYDAFRPEYLKRGVTPYMNKFREEGVSTEFLYNVFPTKTFVNHHTLATGFYPAAHGVLANSLYDSKRGKLGYGYELYHYNESIWPIWTANEKAGKHSGCMMWPGSDYAYDGTNCTFNIPFNMNIPWNDRVDTIMSWFTHEKTPVNLVMLYIEEPDVHGHVYSPDSNVTTGLVSKLDDLTKYIQEKLVKNNLDGRVNVIHVSDHGMSSVSSPNFINLTDFVRIETVTFYGSSPVLQAVPNDNSLLDEIYANLTKGVKQNGNFKAYTPDNLPKRWRAANAQRMGPILLVADMDYAFQDMYESAEWYSKNYNVPFTPKTKYGVHGYDNAEESMHAIFMAKGPLFPNGKHLKPFSTVDLYNLFCRILSIKCRHNEGVDQWNALLRTPSSKPARPARKPAAMILFAAVGAVIVILFAFVAFIFWRCKRTNAFCKPVRLHITDELEESEMVTIAFPEKGKQISGERLSIEH